MTYLKIEGELLAVLLAFGGGYRYAAALYEKDAAELREAEAVARTVVRKSSSPIKIVIAKIVIPVVLINGENANDKSVGAIVLLISEQIPNTPPRIAPAAGPNKIAPRITGICTVVALMIGSCIIPSGVFARTITIAAISATLTIQLVSCFFVFIFNFPPCYHSR